MIFILLKYYIFFNSCHDIGQVHSVNFPFKM